MFENEEYNFEIERCKNLTLPIEQTAVARAIVSEIQINIMTKYSEDPSGTTPFINSYLEYKKDNYYNKKYTQAIFIYTAPNGNYKEVKDWQ